MNSIVPYIFVLTPYTHHTSFVSTFYYFWWIASPMHLFWLFVWLYWWVPLVWKNTFHLKRHFFLVNVFSVGLFLIEKKVDFGRNGLDISDSLTLGMTAELDFWWYHTFTCRLPKNQKIYSSVWSLFPK